MQRVKNKKVKVQGMVQHVAVGGFKVDELTAIITNDENGKTLSINNGIVQFTIPFEPIEKYLK